MKIKLVAALLVCVAIGSAFAAPANAKPKQDNLGPSPSGETSGDDKKTLPGTACKPMLAQIGGFKYQYASLINISDNQGFADCRVSPGDVWKFVSGG